MWPFKRNEQKPKQKDHNPIAPNCKHDDWEIVERRDFADMSGSLNGNGSWGTTRCKVCGKEGGWNY